MPQAEYEKLAKDVEIYQQKNGDLLVTQGAGNVGAIAKQLVAQGGGHG